MVGQWPLYPRKQSLDRSDRMSAPILLQKSLNTERGFSRLKPKQARTANKSGSRPITEVTDEFSARSCDPDMLTRKTRLWLRNFLIKEDFCNKIGQ